MSTVLLLHTFLVGGCSASTTPITCHLKMSQLNLKRFTKRKKSLILNILFFCFIYLKTGLNMFLVNFFSFFICSFKISEFLSSHFRAQIPNPKGSYFFSGLGLTMRAQTKPIWVHWLTVSFGTPSSAFISLVPIQFDQKKKESPYSVHFVIFLIENDFNYKGTRVKISQSQKLPTPIFLFLFHFIQFCHSTNLFIRACSRYTSTWNTSIYCCI